MNFDELHGLIPYAKGGKEKVLSMSPYPGVVLKMPGRHQKETIPMGGDFVVIIDTPTMHEHQFKHDDIFNDIELKNSEAPEVTLKLMGAYLVIALGGDPVDYDGKFESLVTVGINPYLFLRAIQCLAVAEHRRYAQHENMGGGRYLPFRFAAGLVAGEWTADTCITKQKYGRGAVEKMESKYGTPALTKELIECLKNP